MRIDILISVMPKGINNFEVSLEEYNLRNKIDKLLIEEGYSKFIVAGGDIINDDIKGRVVLD